MEDPGEAKGLIRREVVRVVTPGTVIESDLLPDGRNNYLAAIYYEDLTIGVCFADISTGKVRATYFAGISAEEDLLGELEIIGPAEIITNIDVTKHAALQSYIKEHEVPYSHKEKTYFAPETATEWFREIAGAYAKDQVSFQPAVYTCGAAFAYIAEMQKTDLAHIEDISFYENTQYLEMDTSTRRNLELMETMLGKEKKGSLLGILDKTNTPMGRRLLRSYLEHPLRDVKKIITRQRSVAELVSNHMLREEIRHLLSSVLDMERILTKILYGTGSARELRSLAQSIEVLPQIKTLLQAAESKQLSAIWENIDALADIYDLLSTAIADNPPFLVREGGMIREGYDSKVDELRSIINNTEEYIRKLEEEEREKTGIKTLRIGSNRVFGYYIEVTRSFSDKVPSNYIRKQTLTNCERYISEELKELESTIVGADDKLKNLEYQLFCEVREVVVKNASRVRKSGAAIAELDVYASLAQVAAQNQYVCPEGGLQRYSYDQGWASSCSRTVCTGRLFRSQRCISGYGPKSVDADYRSEHGGKIYIYAPDGVDCSHGPNRVFCSCGRGTGGRCGQAVHPGRCVGRSGQRPVYLYAGNAGGGVHFAACHKAKPDYL